MIAKSQGRIVETGWSRARRTILPCAAGLACAAVALASGCNIVGPATYLIAGPEKVAAQHQLADVPTIVFVDDRRNVVNPTSFRKVIADKTLETLMVNKVLSEANALSSVEAMALATQRERASKVLSIEEIGKAVGARQVVYVEMDQFQDTPDGFTPRPTATVRIKVIDVENRQRVFPAEEELESSRRMQAMTREVDPGLYATRSGRLKVFEALAGETGASIAKLFYKHEDRPLGRNLNPR